MKIDIKGPQVEWLVSKIKEKRFSILKAQILKYMVNWVNSDN